MAGGSTARWNQVYKISRGSGDEHLFADPRHGNTIHTRLRHERDSPTLPEKAEDDAITRSTLGTLDTLNFPITLPQVVFPKTF